MCLLSGNINGQRWRSPEPGLFFIFLFIFIPAIAHDPSPHPNHSSSHFSFPLPPLVPQASPFPGTSSLLRMRPGFSILYATPGTIRLYGRKCGKTAIHRITVKIYLKGEEQKRTTDANIVNRHSKRDYRKCFPSGSNTPVAKAVFQIGLPS